MPAPRCRPPMPSVSHLSLLAARSSLLAALLGGPLTLVWLPVSLQLASGDSCLTLRNVQPTFLLPFFIFHLHPPTHTHTRPAISQPPTRVICRQAVAALSLSLLLLLLLLLQRLGLHMAVTHLQSWWWGWCDGRFFQLSPSFLPSACLRGA